MLTGSSSKVTDLNCNSHRQILSLSSFEFCRCNVSLRALKKYFHIVARLYNYTIFKLTSLGEALMCDSSNRRYRELLLLFRAFFLQNEIWSSVVKLGSLDIGKLDFITNSNIKILLNLKQSQNTMMPALWVSRFF